MQLLNALLAYPGTILKLFRSPFEGLQELVDDGDYTHHFSCLCTTAGLFAAVSMLKFRSVSPVSYSLFESTGWTFFLRVFMAYFFLVPYLLLYWMFTRWRGLPRDFRRYWKLSCLAVSFILALLAIGVLLFTFVDLRPAAEDNAMTAFGIVYLLHTAAVQSKFWDQPFSTGLGYSLLAGFALPLAAALVFIPLQWLFMALRLPF